MLSELLRMRSLQLCCYYRAVTTNTDAERPPTESVCLRAAPKNSPLMGPLYAFHNSQDKSRLDGCEQTTDAGTRESERYK